MEAGQLRKGVREFQAMSLDFQQLPTFASPTASQEDCKQGGRSELDWVCLYHQHHHPCKKPYVGDVGPVGVMQGSLALGAASHSWGQPSGDSAAGMGQQLRRWLRKPKFSRRNGTSWHIKRPTGHLNLGSKMGSKLQAFLRVN